MGKKKGPWYFEIILMKGQELYDSQFCTLSFDISQTKIKSWGETQKKRLEILLPDLMKDKSVIGGGVDKI